MGQKLTNQECISLLKENEIPLNILEILSQNKNHPKYQKTSREIFMILQSEEAKFYFKSKNNLIKKKYPGLAEKINKQNRK